MRLVGPNCLGVLNTAPSVAPQRDLRPGDAARPATSASSRQSGALGLALIELAERSRPRRLLVRLDRQPRRHHRQRPPRVLGGATRRTDVALLYIESFSDPRRFSRVARRIGRTQADRRRQERPLGGGRARHRVPHRRAARRLRRDRRRALRAGRRDPHRDASPSCSTSPRCSPTSRCRRAAGSGSSPTRAARGSCAPTPARRPGWRCRSCPPRCASALASFLAAEAALANPVDMIATAERRAIPAGDRGARGAGRGSTR